MQLQLPRKGGSTGFDALYDSRYIHKIQLKDAFSDTEVISFINVDDVLDAIELVGLVDLPGRDGKSVLIIISCHASSNDKPSGSRILIYEVLVKPCTDADEYKDDSQITVNIHKPRLLRTCALTVCFVSEDPLYMQSLGPCMCGNQLDKWRKFWLSRTRCG